MTAGTSLVLSNRRSPSYLPTVSRSVDDRLQTKTVVQLVANVYKNIPDPIASGDCISAVDRATQEAPVDAELTEIDKAEAGHTKFRGEWSGSQKCVSNAKAHKSHYRLSFRACISR